MRRIYEEMIIQDDSVAVRFTARGTHLGPWLQFAATRQGIEYTSVTLAHITAGRITWHPNKKLTLSIWRGSARTLRYDR